MAQNQNVIKSPPRSFYVDRIVKHHRTCTRNSLCIQCENIEFPSVWNELRNQDQLCDGVIRLQSGVCIKVHRAILSASSLYFKASFTYNSNNSINSEKKEETEINVDTTETLMRLILDYAYTGTCNITWSNVEDLLAAADRFEVIGLIRACCQFLLKELKPHNCIGIYLFAKYYFCTELENCAREFILGNFRDVASDSPELENISGTELFSFLNDEHLNVNTEELVFEVIKRWVEVDLQERITELPKLLTCVRFGLMGYRFFRDRFMAWPPIQQRVVNDLKI